MKLSRAREIVDAVHYYAFDSRGAKARPIATACHRAKTSETQYYAARKLIKAAEEAEKTESKPDDPSEQVIAARHASLAARKEAEAASRRVAEAEAKLAKVQEERDTYCRNVELARELLNERQRDIDHLREKLDASGEHIKVLEEEIRNYRRWIGNFTANVIAGGGWIKADSKKWEAPK